MNALFVSALSRYFYPARFPNRRDLFPPSRRGLTQRAARLLGILLAPLASGAFAVSPPDLSAFPPGNASVGTLAPGTRLARVFLNDADALCNDGSTPAIYVRPAGAALDASKWIIYLQGGGSCGNGGDCLKRWQHYQTSYGMQKMSTSIDAALWDSFHAAPPAGWVANGAGHYTVPPSMGGHGIFSGSLGNPFRDWNQVFAYYCSSDEWSGQMTNQVLDGVDPASGSSTDFTIHFRGASIFDALVDTLRVGAQACLGDECRPLPSLDDASFILLAGSSAGGNGVKHNLDRFRDTMHAVNGRMEVRGVVDAAGSPFTAALPWPPISPDPDRPYLVSYEDYMRYQWNEVYSTVWQARVDESCAAENPGALQYRCADTTHVLRHHITSPFFHRMDLQDNTGLKGYQHVFYPDTVYPATLAEERFAADVRRQLQDLGAFSAVLLPRYPNELNRVNGDPQWLHPGLFGPRCTDHVGLIGDKAFGAQVLPQGGAMTSYADALYQWVTTAPGGLGGGGGGPVLIGDVGIGSAGAPQCP